MLAKQIITEKSSINKLNNKVTFMVAKKRSKKEIIRFIQSVFKVKVVSINTCIYRGKIKRIGKNTGKLKNWKKIIVQVLDKKNMKRFEDVLVDRKK